VIALLDWLADCLFGPRCPIGCGYRARGPRTMFAHMAIDHAGDDQ
jgi:hypothetical protein